MSRKNIPVIVESREDRLEVLEAKIIEALRGSREDMKELEKIKQELLA